MESVMVFGAVPAWFNGDGYGYGDGDGDGYGYGYGYGSGYGSLKGAVSGFLAALPRVAKLRAKQLIKAGAKLAYWRSTKDGKPANGGSGESVQVGTVQKTAGPLSLCNRGTLHATYFPSKWQGERLWLVAMIGPIIEQDDKMGALEREIIAEITPAKRKGRPRTGNQQ